MERSKDKAGIQEVLWVKRGGGSLRIDRTGPKGKKGHKIIPSGMKFWAYEYEIPKAFRDVVIAVTELPSRSEDEVGDVAEIKYKLTHKGGGKYDVTDSNGKKLNEELLSKEEAQKLIDSLK